MLGDNSNRPKRQPKEIKFSNRKIISQQNLDSMRQKPSQSGGGGSFPKRAAGGLSLGTIVIVIIFLLISNMGGGSSGADMGSLLTSVLGAGGGDATGAFAPQQPQADLQSTAGDKIETIAAQPKRPYTIMVYMNGTDLESKYGCATKDLQEMLGSGFDSEKINLLVLTGGTSRWQNDVISDNTSVYKLENGGLKRLTDLGMASMAEVSNLKGFVDFGIESFPADKYGFIFWNHGGGTIYGYGSDQNYNGARMSISQIGDAFAKSKMTSNKFEFIGFDCCLMATLETAYLLEPFAKYMIASEETEPGLGWDYAFLGNLSEKPNATGHEIGKVIVDKFVSSNEGSREQATLSVMDLSKIPNVSDKFESLMSVAGDAVAKGGFNTISRARSGTKSFGYTGEDRSSFDIVDIKDFAQKLESSFPKQSSELVKSVESAITYYRNTRNIENAYGISTYIPYAAKQVAPRSVSEYSKIGILPDFVDFLGTYTEKLTGARVERSSVTRAKPRIVGDNVAIKLDPKELEEINKITFTIWKQLEEGSDYFVKLGLDSDVNIADDGTITTSFDGYWATIAGQTACFYEVERTKDYQKYSTPAVLNGQDVSLIVIFDKENPDGKILGAIPPSPQGGVMAAKYMEPIKAGDKLALKYFAQLFLENEADAAKYTEAEKWLTGQEFTVTSDLSVQIVPVDDELYLYGFWIEDTQGNDYYTDFIEIRY